MNARLANLIAVVIVAAWHAYYAIREEWAHNLGSGFFKPKT